MWRVSMPLGPSRIFSSRPSERGLSRRAWGEWRVRSQTALWSSLLAGTALARLCRNIVVLVGEAEKGGEGQQAGARARPRRSVWPEGCVSTGWASAAQRIRVRNRWRSIRRAACVVSRHDAPPLAKRASMGAMASAAVRAMVMPLPVNGGIMARASPRARASGDGVVAGLPAGNKGGAAAERGGLEIGGVEPCRQVGEADGGGGGGEPPRGGRGGFHGRGGKQPAGIDAAVLDAGQADITAIAQVDFQNPPRGRGR